MEIKYFGHSSFLIKSKDAKIITDPFDSSIGIKFPKTEADMVTISHDHFDHNKIELVTAPMGEQLLTISMPGEFEKKGVRIFGFRSFHDAKQGSERGETVLYKVETENISALHCGDLGFVPDDSFIDMIGDVDILFVPVGGHFTIDADQAVSVIKKIEPSIVIPMHYNHSKLDQKKFGELTPVSEFLKKFSIETLQPIPKLIVRKEELEQEMKIVMLDINS